MRIFYNYIKIFYIIMEAYTSTIPVSPGKKKVHAILQLLIEFTNYITADSV